MYDVYHAAAWGPDMNKLVCIDRDRLTKDDYVCICDKNSLAEVMEAEATVFHGLRSARALCSNCDASTLVGIKPMEYVLPCENTLWDLLLLLNNLKATFTYDGRVWAIQDITIDTLADRAYIGKQLLWDINPKFLGPGAVLHVRYKGTSDVLTGFTCIGNVHSEDKYVLFELYPQYSACTWSYTYSLLRMSSTELQVIADTFLSALGYTLGFELGYTVSQMINGITRKPGFKTTQYQKALAGMTGCHFDISFPDVWSVQENVGRIVRKLAEDKNKAIQELLKACRSKGVYAQLFCQGFMSQMTDDFAITDYEYEHNSCVHDVLWSSFLNLYSYNLALRVLDEVFIEARIPLAEGVLHIERST